MLGVYWVAYMSDISGIIHVRNYIGTVAVTTPNSNKLFSVSEQAWFMWVSISISGFGLCML